ncbi:mechanosensitive ion channel domain-containing protein [Methylovulum psychrotolerans]|uniref:Mechanosensitive ion channel protein MscS n=1 Tax=Methylovulum psychrotolerans TaxID=1704499 RepID=A0A2S5CRY2_9GAMM|nr:mechanosensitive ion channel domain-containing protein [Methylovulum psychrotolerans]POZ53564.1 mechanosensitive ion channel protein MscS [Methylovulum psychrotolerans]
MKQTDKRRPYFYAQWPLLTVLLILGIGAVQAANTQTGQKPPISASTALQAKIDAVTARQDFDETTKTSVLKFYHSAQDNLANIELFNSKTESFKQATKQAPEAIKKLQKDLEQIQQKQAKQKPESFTDIATDELEQRLIIEKEKLSNLDEQLKNLDTELTLQNSRPPLIRQETLTAQQDLDNSQKKSASPATSTTLKIESEAEQLYLKTLIDARTAELKMLDIEAISNPVRVDLLKAQYQLLDSQRSMEAPILTAIDSILAERRLQAAKEAQDALSQAEKDLAGKHLVIQMLTRENIQFSKDLQATTSKTDAYNEQEAKLDSQVTEIDNDFKSAEKKISLAGLSPALGKILREQRRNLLIDIQQGLQSESVQNETALTSLELFKVEDKLQKLADVDHELQQIMSAQVDPHMPNEQRMMIQAELRVLLNNQKELLNKVMVADDTYLRSLGDFDFARQQMVAQATKYAAFLDERLLWVPSSEPINADFLPGLYHAGQWLLSPMNWAEVIKDTLKSLYYHAFAAVLAIASLLVLVFSQHWNKTHLLAIAEQVGKFYSDHFLYTVKALLHLLLLILPLPLLLFYWGWFLSHTWNINEFSKVVGTGFQVSAVPMFFLQFFYRLFAPQGIARKHFQWQAETASLFRRQIAWLRFIAVPSVFLINSTGASGVALYSDNIGRLALVLSMVAMAAFFRNILHPTRGLLQYVIAAAPQGWLHQSRYFWYPGAISLPLIIIGFAVAGYYLSALELQQQLIITLRLVFVLVVIHSLVFRWLTLVNRQLAIANDQQRRKLAAQPEKPHIVGAEDVVVPIEEPLIDIPKINAQTIKLLNVFICVALLIGIWLIWKNILPAFSFLDHIQLWEYQVTEGKQDTMKPVTLTNLLLAGVYVFITVVSVVNFSGLMEIVWFRRLSVEPGSRYAINKLAKYLLISIGFLCVANELGGSWTQVQWLVAALSVGLGFGLQEIFANLVSGIILLFERPIRVGDTVTIGDVTGRVSRIQMRATTIMDWDQKELVVPNKTFITNQLVNWTLSDSITRVVIPIGIAYGTDLEKAHQLMLETVQNTPMVLTDPEPVVVLTGFGDSSLMFSIRVFVSEMAHRLQVVHNLHLRLDRALREHNIEIPFPQREVHVRETVTTQETPPK